ncbi:type II toxin-antitoxin system Phd/YefM family antitoxin [Terriglobus aquaticus]|uniref:Type II toxin-antitoxin system Phd/YefM family antitoxin n=1 Tax=Terriglobus aquaticus TaxID=940139 RepID=A0ABW9KIS2_9BACT|nr:type II toxin-antitoxin system prevent-host-death family antitoxin [Terriglobus aquaticus]
MTVTMFEAKTRLSELVQKAQAGEEIIITSGREKTPVARIEPVKQPKVRRLGLIADPGYTFSDSFWDPLPEEELVLWEGGA